MSQHPIATADTPMIRQYRDIKAQHEDAILFFRLGDFYEMFMDDATVAAKALELTLTGRGKDENRIPMCGIPYHASENYITKLIAKGFKVAICEQTEEATAGKGLTKREVVRIITPGTVTSASMLDEKENNYLLAVSAHGKDQHLGCSVLDITTGEFRVFTLDTTKDLDGILTNFPIREILTDGSIKNYSFPDGILINTVTFNTVPQASAALQKFFQRYALQAFGTEDAAQAYPAAQAILSYVGHTQKDCLASMTKLLPWKRHRCLGMDKVTMKNLELTESREQQLKTGTLFWVLDHTKTAMGARALKLMIKNPLTEVPTLEKRLDAIDALLHDLLSREEIRDILSQLYDLERITTRIITNQDNPRDCIALKETLQAITPLDKILHHLPGELFEKLGLFFHKARHPQSPYQRIIDLVDRSILESPPPTLKSANVIRPGYSEKLDELMLSFKEVRQWIAQLEPQERQATGIKSLKVGFNKVFGYTIEIPASQSHAAPPHYIRKQTLANAERYITPELKEKENILLHAETKQQELETEIYREIIDQIREHTEPLQVLARHLARIDTLQSLATAAQKNTYTRPQFVDQDQQLLDIQEGRHPILEKNSTHPFVPNTITMTQEKNRLMLLTGPNMAGKSTLMRQVALIVVMAQIGSFVPATRCRLSPVDKLFTRIGALDNLYFGQSTFMVEMLETATIINNATQNSLIILDEVGRGTSTYDGMSIACAVSEHLHNVIQARTLFATHYHELTGLQDRLSALENYRMDVQETKNGIVFTHTCLPGPADKSYGVHVAQMAGLPATVVKRAENLLKTLESQQKVLLDTKKPHQLQLF